MSRQKKFCRKLSTEIISYPGTTVLRRNNDLLFNGNSLVYFVSVPIEVPNHSQHSCHVKKLSLLSTLVVLKIIWAYLFTVTIYQDLMYLEAIILEPDCFSLQSKFLILLNQRLNWRVVMAIFLTQKHCISPYCTIGSCTYYYSLLPIPTTMCDFFLA